jgi:7-keto-8-aminopelargonate synthetase-like enzyme
MNRGRSYVFSTALPLASVAAASAALRVSLQVPACSRPAHVKQPDAPCAIGPADSPTRCRPAVSLAPRCLAMQRAAGLLDHGPSNRGCEQRLTL